MKITPSLLIDAVGCTPAIAERYAGPLTEACERFDISTPGRLAAFLANVGHESASLSKQRESMNYAADRLVSVFGAHRITPEQAAKYGRTATQTADQAGIANIVYGGSWGVRNIGNTQPGDGWRFRAAGPIGTTGRANFRELQPALLMAGYEDVPDFEAEPERLIDPRWGAAATGYFWSSRDLNVWADRGDFLAVCRGINLGSPKSSGTPNGMADRKLRWSKALSAINLHAKAESAPANATADSPSDLGAMPSGPAEATTNPVPVGGYMPAGEFIPETPTMAPFVAAALQAILPAVPKLIETFGSGSEVSKRNEKAAELVVSVAKDALGAVNEQEVAERMANDPNAAGIVRQAVQENWYQIVESGGGGVDGARQFLKDSGGDPAVWSIVRWVTFAALAFLALANIGAFAVYIVSLVLDKQLETATQMLVQVFTADIGAALTAFGFWLGSSWGSKSKAQA